MSGWGCPFEDRGSCTQRAAPCEPGTKGCVLEGRTFAGGEAAGMQTAPPEPADGRSSTHDS